MNITLSKVHYVPSMSEETNCFDAIVCIDGKPSFHVSNIGQGGSNFYKGLDNNPNWQKDFKNITEYAIRKYPEFQFEQVDALVDDLFQNHIISKTLTTLLKKKMAVTMKDKPGIFSYKMPYDPEFLKRIQSKNPNVDQCLNTLPFDQALALFIKNEN